MYRQLQTIQQREKIINTSQHVFLKQFLLRPVLLLSLFYFYFAIFYCRERRGGKGITEEEEGKSRQPAGEEEKA